MLGKVNSSPFLRLKEKQPNNLKRLVFYKPPDAAWTGAIAKTATDTALRI